MDLIWLFVGLIVSLWFIQECWKKTHFKRHGISADFAWPVIGHFHKFLFGSGFVQYLIDATNKYGKIWGLFSGNTPVLIISDADILKEILVRKFSHFYNRRYISLEDSPFHKSLTRLEGARWKEVRNTITPAFSASKMKPIAGLFNNTCDVLVRHMKSAAESSSEVEVKSLYGNMTMDAIAQAGFGLEVHSQDDPNNLFVKHAKEIMQMKFTRPAILIVMFAPIFIPILNYFKIGMIPSSAKKFFLDVTGQAVALRDEKEENKRIDLLQLMLDTMNDTTVDPEDNSEDIPEMAGSGHVRSAHKTKLTEDEVMAQALLFYLAGYETTNTSLTLISYSLATHPDLQQKLYEEVLEFAPTRDSVTYETVNKMEYLRKFVNETLRLYPPAVASDRVCTETVTIGDLTIPKGADILYNILALHLDPDYWTDPEKFDPERFTKEETAKRHPYAYLPFGTGPRNCIGMRFALLLVKAAVVRVVQNFKFEPSAKTPIPLKYGMRTVVPDDGIHLRIIPRE